jgi:hypothetical protein
MDNDDQNFEYKHYKLNNVKHVVNDKHDMYNNMMMNREDFEQILFSVVELMGNNFRFLNKEKSFGLIFRKTLRIYKSV